MNDVQLKLSELKEQGWTLAALADESHLLTGIADDREAPIAPRLARPKRKVGCQQVHVLEARTGGRPGVLGDQRLQIFGRGQSPVRLSALGEVVAVAHGNVVAERGGVSRRPDRPEL